MSTLLDSDTERDLVSRWMRGNQDAADFAQHLLWVCHLWDDLIDQDNPRTAAEINAAFRMLLIDIPRNPFYRQHFTELQPLLASMVNDWLTANVLEREESGRDIAYTLRVNILSVVAHCAFLCGGWEWAQEVGPHIRRTGQRETLAQYKEEFDA